MSAWEEQWKRVERYYQRFKESYEGYEGRGEPSDYRFDDMLAFFQNCFHLRDWLKEDNFIPSAINQTPCDYVKTHTALQICADLANATKHMVLTKPPKSGSVPGPAGNSMFVTGGSNTVWLKSKIEHNGGAIDSLELATRCMEAWKTYLGKT